MFHEKLKAIRINRGRTQRDLADYLNISSQSVSKWEKGEALPSMEYLPKIAKFYNCDINSFFQEEGEKSSAKKLLEELKSLEEELEELEGEEPDEDDEEAYEEWEQERERLLEEIEEIQERGTEGTSNLSERPKQAGCPTEKYKEFFQIAKEVLVYNGDGVKLSEYLEKNGQMKESIKHICQLIMATNSISISMIQRRMEIGYNKAGEIVEGLEKIGVITPFDGKNTRKVISKQFRKLTVFFGINF